MNMKEASNGYEGMREMKTRGVAKRGEYQRGHEGYDMDVERWV